MIKPNYLSYRNYRHGVIVVEDLFRNLTNFYLPLCAVSGFSREDNSLDTSGRYICRRLWCHCASHNVVAADSDY